MKFFIVDPHVYYTNTQESAHRKAVTMVKVILLPFKTTRIYTRQAAA